MDHHQLQVIFNRHCQSIGAHAFNSNRNCVFSASHSQGESYTKLNLKEFIASFGINGKMIIHAVASCWFNHREDKQTDETFHNSFADWFPYKGREKKRKEKDSLTISLNMHITVKWHAGSIVEALWQRFILHGVNHSYCRLCRVSLSRKVNNSFNFLSLFHATLRLDHLLRIRRRRRWSKKTLRTSFGFDSNSARELFHFHGIIGTSCNGTIH
jgi:hypothetical protein